MTRAFYARKRFVAIILGDPSLAPATPLTADACPRSMRR